MNVQSNRELFLKALECGDYRKARWWLRGRESLVVGRSREIERISYNYCFWGLACEIYRQENPETSRWAIPSSFAIVCKTNIDDGEGVEHEYDPNWIYYSERPPRTIVEFFGFSESDVSQMIELSDDRNHSFEHMATQIRCWDNGGPHPIMEVVHA